MKHALLVLILVPLFAVNFLSAQALIIAQAPDGAGWRFTLVITNTTATAGVVSVQFFQDTDSSGDTGPWTPPFVEAGVNLAALNVPAGSSVFLHSPGTAAQLTQGWAQITGSPGIQAYVIYTYTKGLSSSDATAPGMAAASRFLVPFDNTGSLATEVALVNPNPAAALAVTVNLKTSGGVNQAALNIPPSGQIAVVMSSKFPTTAGQDGLAEFYSNSGNMVLIALRSNLNKATGVFSFTSAPAFNESGPPIISTSGGGGGGGGGVPAGDITFAGFSIGKTTGTLGASERAGGLIAAYTPTAWNAPYNGTKIDKCIVYDVTYSGANYPAAPSLSLDAGKMTLTGPGLVGGSVVVPEINAGGIGPVYSLQLPSNTLVGGGTYQLAAAGGTQVEAFNASASLPNNFTTNASTINSINRSSPLAINWTGTGFENIIITAQGTSLSQTGTHQVVVTCVVPASQGSYSVPTAALSQLPAISGLPNGIGSLAVTTTPAFTGTISSQSSTGTSLTPNLVGGGKVEYGGFAPFFSVVQSVTIQ